MKKQNMKQTLAALAFAAGLMFSANKAQAQAAVNDIDITNGRVTAVGSSGTGLIFKMDTGLPPNCQGTTGDWIYVKSYVVASDTDTQTLIKYTDLVKSDLPSILLLADALNESMTVFTTKTPKNQQGQFFGYCTAVLIVKNK